MTEPTVLETIFRHPVNPPSVTGTIDLVHCPGEFAHHDLDQLYTRIQHDNWLQGAIHSLTKALRPQFHARLRINGESEQDPSDYNQYVKGEYVEPVLAAANQHRLECLPPLVVKEEGLNIDNSIRVDLDFGEPPFPGYSPTCQITHPLPTLVFLPPTALDIQSWASDDGSLQKNAQSEVLLNEVNSILKQQPERQVCITDTKSVLLFRGAEEDILYEPVSNLADLPLRAVIASLIWSAIEKTSTTEQPQYFYRPYIEPSIAHIPSGALEDPSRPRPTWEEARTWQSRSDFDFFTVVNDPQVGELLNRWMKEVPLQYNDNPVPRVGDHLDASATSFEKYFTPIKALFDSQPLPEETENWLAKWKRPSLSELAEQLRTCDVFGVEITQALPAHDPRDGRSFICRLNSIDGQNLDVPHELRLKLFDDRQMNFEQINKYEDSVHEWFITEVLPTTATELVRYEDANFRRLSHAQGGLLPYYYGAHEFTLPDGRKCWGILTELVQGVPLSKVAGQLSENAKIDIIQSMRHFVRVLQYADVQRSSWLHDDISVSELNSCTVMNMSHARFSTLDGQIQRADDYREVKQLLSHALDHELVDVHFSQMEEWDKYVDA